jgi:hypothetical protein
LKPTTRAHFFPTDISKGGAIDDCGLLEMAYAPPFATAIDALNAAANVAIKDFLDWIAAPSSQPDRLALDIRHPKEVEPFARNSAIFGWASPITRYAGALTNCPWTKP